MIDAPPIASRTVRVALIVAIAQFMQMLDGAVIGIALPPMARDFHVSPVTVGFGITVYVLAGSVFIPASAWIADRIGARTLFVWALAGFTVASLLCGASRELWEFIVARVLQGIAGALMAPVGQLILMRSVERAQLLRVINLSSAPMLIAPVIGPPLGGLLTTWFGWSWIFYINLPAGLLGVVLALRWLPNPRGDRRPFDLAGFLLNALALTPLLWGLSAIGGGANRPLAIAAIVAGAILGALALRHARRAAHPILSLVPFRHRTFRLTTGSGAFIVRLPIVALLFVLPILLQAGFGMTAFTAGLLFLAHGGGDLSMKMFITRAFRRFGYRSMLLTSTVALTLATGTAALLARSTPLALVVLVLYVSGCARSFLMTGLASLAFSDVEQHELPSATTLSSVGLQLATAFGVSISSLLFDISRLLRGGAPGPPAPIDCSVTLAVFALLSLLALPLFLRLPRDAGQALSGHRTPIPAPSFDQ